MPDEKRTILVFGATGRQGGAVAQALLGAGWRVRALVRDPSAPAAAALARSGVELVGGTLTDRGAIRRAMEDAYGVFSVMPADLSAEDEVGAGTSVADLAVEGGVEHLVYSSGASVDVEPTGIARIAAKPKIEAHIRTLPITATIVRPMIFMEMLAQPGTGLAQGRLVSLPRPDQAMQLIAVRDIGRVVAAMFADRARFGGETITIAGDRVTGLELAALFGASLDRPMIYERLSDAAFAASPDLKHIAASLDDGPLSKPVDLAALRRIVPELLSVRGWLDAEGGVLLAEAARGGDR